MVENATLAGGSPTPLCGYRDAHLAMVSVRTRCARCRASRLRHRRALGLSSVPHIAGSEVHLWKSSVGRERRGLAKLTVTCHISVERRTVKAQRLPGTNTPRGARRDRLPVPDL